MLPEEYKDRLAPLIYEHFPDVVPDLAVDIVNRCFFRWQGIVGLEIIERIDTPSDKDIDTLEQVARHLRRASESLLKVGFHGRNAIMKIAEAILDPQNHRKPSVGTMNAPSVISDDLNRIATEIEEAAATVPPDATSFLAPLGRGSKRRRPVGIAAYFIARDCASIFEKLTGREPARLTDRKTGKAYGPLHDFVGAVFEALKIEANPDRALRGHPIIDNIQ